MVKVLEGAEPFQYEGNDVGVLVIHGFTGTTQSMRYLGEGLHKKFGFSVVGPRLPGHGTSPDDMETTGYLDWLGEAERALHELSARKSKVFVTGLSMGGTLTLNLAGRFPKEVLGIAPIAAATSMAGGAMFDVLMMNPGPKRLPGIGSDLKTKDIVELAYKETPVACIGEIIKLVAITRSMLDRVQCPSLVIHGREDHVVPPNNAMEIVNGISSDDVRLLWLNHSYHVATIDNDKDLIVDRVGGFFKELSA